jgi:NADH-quinone oxidoreductase subunit J
MINVLIYTLLSILTISSLCVVLLQNTFFALLFLILSFLLVSTLLLLFESEFLALLLIIIYVGAVAVLLLFVLMMLDTKLKNLYKNIFVYFPFGFFINGIFFFEFFKLINNSFKVNNIYNNNFFFNTYTNWYTKIDALKDIEVYGQILYTQFVLQFLIVGLILFLSLIGVVFLTVEPIYKNYKSQTSFCQLSRNFSEQIKSQILL